MSEWAGPPQSSDTPRRPTDGVDALLAKVAELKQGLRDLPSGLLKAAGISISAEGMTIDSSLTVHGSGEFTGDLDVTGGASFSGDTIIGGNAAITGTLSLPSGIIDNDALANPIDLAANFANADEFTVTTSATDFVTFTIPIPAGYSRALVKAEGMAFVFNPTGSGDYFYHRIYVDSPNLSTWSRRLLTDIDAGNGGSNTVTKQHVFEGLDGGVLTVRQELYTAFASMAHHSNGATATAAAWFLR